MGITSAQQPHSPASSYYITGSSMYVTSLPPETTGTKVLQAP